MGTLCIVGVDDNVVLKDFVRCHVERLRGAKVTVGHWYPDHRHNGETIRYSYPRRRPVARLRKLLPHALYERLAVRRDLEAKALDAAFAAFFADHDIDVILAEFGTTGADVRRHAEQSQIPLIVHFHGHDAHRSATVEPFRDRYRDMFRYAYRIVSVSHYMTAALVALGADPDRIVYNPYGPRDEFFANDPDYRQTILSVGRFTDIKANYLTLMAFCDACREFPEARLVMVGEGELLETCRTLARVWGVEHRVSFPGAIPHAAILPLFAEACCFAQHSVAPSYGDAEGTPVAILEAQAAALPVIATRHAGIMDAVIDGETGFLGGEEDVAAMAASMRRLLGDRELCRTMGLKARDHIRKNYSIDRHITRLQTVIDAARAQA